MGTCVRNCVGRCSQIHSDDEYGTDSSWEQLAVGYIRQQCRSSNSFVAMVSLFPELGANPTVSAGNGTGANDDNRMQVDSQERQGEGQRQTLKPERTSHEEHKQHEQYRTVTELDIGRKSAGDQVEELTTTPPVTSTTHRKARTTRKAKAKANMWTLWKRISLLKQPQPCRILHKHRAQLELSRAIQTGNRKVGSWVRQSIPCLPQGDKLVQSGCLLRVVHSFTYVQSSFSRTTSTVARSWNPHSKLSSTVT